MPSLPPYDGPGAVCAHLIKTLQDGRLTAKLQALLTAAGITPDLVNDVIHDTHILHSRYLPIPAVPSVKVNVVSSVELEDQLDNIAIPCVRYESSVEAIVSLVTADPYATERRLTIYASAIHALWRTYQRVAFEGIERPWIYRVLPEEQNQSQSMRDQFLDEGVFKQASSQGSATKTGMEQTAVVATVRHYVRKDQILRTTYTP